ncbi:MAG TPA: hypothetical protein VNR38_12305 [Ureibacillus sp.]|nr:hypothetical protein [Ureibacillus sp.]
MQKVLGWFCVIGGLLWGIKPLYDALVNGRRLNQGYIPSDPTDYISFIFPLLCISGLLVIYKLYKSAVKGSVIILIVSIVLSAAFSFFEIYFYGSGLPFGLIFLFTGTISMTIGSLYLYLQLKKAMATRDILSLTSLVLFIDNLLIIVLGFLSEVLPKEINDPLMLILMIFVGFIWAVFGFWTLKLDKHYTVKKSNNFKDSHQS